MTELDSFFLLDVDYNPSQVARAERKKLIAKNERQRRENDARAQASNSERDTRKHEIEKTWKKRPEPGDKPKNVDYLGKRFMFKGFYRDERYARQRMLPGSSEISDTWLLALGKQ